MGTLGIAILLLIVFYIFFIKKTSFHNKSSLDLLDEMIDKATYGEFLEDNTIDGVDKFYRMISKVNIALENGKRAKFDLVYIDEGGIYTIVYKDYNGKIINKNERWTRAVKNGHEEIIENPIVENEDSIDVLSKYLEIDKEMIKSMIVYSDDCILKRVGSVSPNVKIIIREDFDIIMNRYFKNEDKIISIKNIIDYYEKLSEHSQIPDMVKEKRLGKIIEKKLSSSNLNNKMHFKSINEKNLYENLDKYRTEKSAEENVEVYKVFNTKQLKKLIEIMPENEQDLSAITGFNNERVSRYGKDIINIIDKYRNISK